MKTTMFLMMISAVLLNSGYGFAAKDPGSQAGKDQPGQRGSTHRMKFSLRGQPHDYGQTKALIFSGSINNSQDVRQHTIKNADPKKGSFIRVTRKGQGTTVSCSDSGGSAAGLMAVAMGNKGIIGATIIGDHIQQGRPNNGTVTLATNKALTKAASKIAAGYNLKAGEYTVEPLKVELVHAGINAGKIHVNIDAWIHSEARGKTYPVNLTGRLWGNPAIDGATLSIKKLQPGTATR